MRFFNYLLLVLLLSFQSFAIAEQVSSQISLIAAAEQHDGHHSDTMEEGDHCKRDGGCCCNCCKKADASSEQTEKKSCCKDGCCCKSGCGKEDEKSESCHRKTSQNEYSDDAMPRLAEHQAGNHKQIIN